MKTQALLRGPVRVGAVALLVGTLAAGCGLRVEGTDSAGGTLQGALGSGTGLPGETRTGGAVDAGSGGVASGPTLGLGAESTTTDGGGGVGGTISVGAGSGTTGGAADGGSTTSGGSSGAAPALGRGVTDKTITLGFQVATNVQAAFTAVGADTEAVDETKIVDALTAWVNDTGGIAGRKLVVVKHETDPTSGSFASQAAAACATFTEDNKVFAVGSSPVGGNDSLLSCLAAKDTPVVEQNSWLFDDEYYRRFPGYLYQPGRASPTRWAKAYVEGLNQQGYFNNNVKVGLLRFDSAVFERVSKNVLNPAMAAKGHKFEKEIAVRQPAGVSDFGGLAAELNNAIVAFRQAGVTHLMFLENAGIIPFFFMQQAESQSYRPVYALSSVDSPLTQESNQPVEQLKNSYLVGWNPPVDVDPQPDRNPARTQCLEIMKKYGGNATTGFYVQSICDTFTFFRAVLPKVSAFNTAGLRSAAATLGSSYNSPFAMGTSFSARKFDGASLARPGRFDVGCACFKYTGTPFLM